MRRRSTVYINSSVVLRPLDFYIFEKGGRFCRLPYQYGKQTWVSCRSKQRFQEPRFSSLELLQPAQHPVGLLTCNERPENRNMRPHTAMYEWCVYYDKTQPFRNTKEFVVSAPTDRPTGLGRQGINFLGSDPCWASELRPLLHRGGKGPAGERGVGGERQSKKVRTRGGLFGRGHICMVFDCFPHGFGVV